MKLLHNNVLVELIEKQHNTQSIILNSNIKATESICQQAIVVELNHGLEQLLQVGKTILLKYNSGFFCEYQQRKYRIVDINDVLAIL